MGLEYTIEEWEECFPGEPYPSDEMDFEVLPPPTIEDE